MEVITVATLKRDLVPVTPETLRIGDRDGALGVGRRVVSEPRLDEATGRVEVVMQWTGGKREVARLDPDRKFHVARAVVGSGLPLRYRGRSKWTRGMVEVHDTAHPDCVVSENAARGHRWAMRCEHGRVIGRATLARAMDDVQDPRLWCESCVELGPRALTLPV